MQFSPAPSWCGGWALEQRCGSRCHRFAGVLAAWRRPAVWKAPQRAPLVRRGAANASGLFFKAGHTPDLPSISSLRQQSSRAVRHGRAVAASSAWKRWRAAFNASTPVARAPGASFRSMDRSFFSVRHRVPRKQQKPCAKMGDENPFCCRRLLKTWKYILKSDNFAWCGSMAFVYVNESQTFR